LELKFKVSAHIARPVHDVFEAVADPAKLSGYFTTGGAQGRLVTGATVTWDFADFPGAFPVTVVEAIDDTRIVLLCGRREGGERVGENRVTIEFAPVDDGARTLVTITEEGWSQTQAGLDSSYGNCMGWSQMLCALKLWVERAINLREGMYK
jgi:uncharacterized protein YndB with AHSA1/START domain